MSKENIIKDLQNIYLLLTDKSHVTFTATTLQNSIGNFNSRAQEILNTEILVRDEAKTVFDLLNFGLRSFFGQLNTLVTEEPELKPFQTLNNYIERGFHEIKASINAEHEENKLCLENLQELEIVINQGKNM